MHKRKFYKNNIEIDGEFLRKKINQKTNFKEFSKRIGIKLNTLYGNIRYNKFKSNYVLDLIEILNISDEDLRILLKEKPMDWENYKRLNDYKDLKSQGSALSNHPDSSQN